MVGQKLIHNICVENVAANNASRVIWQKYFILNNGVTSKCFA